MALFGFNYSKPGPGVSKDEPQKTAFFRFFDILGRKFWDLVKINLIYFVSVVIFYIPAVYFLLGLHTQKLPLLDAFHYLFFYLCLLPIAVTGPFTAGFTYILRNFVRGEHVFLWSDYKETAKKNMKQSFAVSFINLLLFSVIVFNIQFYFSQIAKNSWLIIPLAICLIVLLLFVFMNFYLYMMLITFDLKVKQLYKNALIFSIIGVGRNILIAVLTALIVLAHVALLLPSLILVPFLSFSLIGLIISFGAWPLLNKYMVAPQSGGTADEEENGVAVFQDIGKEKKMK